MAVTDTRNPTSDDTVAGTWTGTAGSRWQVVDDYPDTGGTDELTHGTTAGSLIFGFSAFSIPTTATNITVFVDYYDYKNGSQTCNIGSRLKIGGTTHDSATHNPANGSANRTQRTDTYSTNPKTAAAWVPADVNGTGSNPLQAFGWRSSDASPTITVSSVRVRVQYDSNYPITCAQGSYTYTGQAQTLQGAHSIACAQGSYSYTGQSVILTHEGANATIICDQGSYTYIGQAQTLTQQRKIFCDFGSYSLNGQAQTLQGAHNILCSQGSYTYTGQAQSLAKTNSQIACVAGSYALTGSVIRFSQKRAVGSGSYTYTGFPQILIGGHGVACAQGSYSLTGQAANFSVGTGIFCSSGSYSLNGQPVSLTSDAQGSSPSPNVEAAAQMSMGMGFGKMSRI